MCFIALIYISKISSVIARAVLTAKWGILENTDIFSDVVFFYQKAAVSVSKSVIASLKLKG